MSKKILLKYIVFVGMFFALTHIAYANLEITEIMYDPQGSNTNHQWVEVYNSDSNSISIDGQKFRFNDGSSHYVNDKVSFSMPASSFIILTGDKNTFLSDHVGFSGTVIDTVMSLDKDGDTISLINDGNTIDSTTYTSSMGGSEDGNSLQKIGTVWKGSTPTPGLPNQSDSNSSANVQSSSSSSTNDNTQSSTAQAPKKETEIPQITTEIISKNLVFAGISFSIDSVTLGLSKELITKGGKFLWNFGDGVIKEEIESKQFEYLYQYPGEYVVTLSYYRNYYSTLPDATDRMIIKVVPSEISISSIGDNIDPFIELENKSTYEISLSKWILKSPTYSFIIPEGTVILPNKKLKLSPKVTGFDSGDMQSIILQNPTCEISATYPLIVKNIYKTSTQNYISDIPANNTKTNNLSNESQVVDLNNLGASAGNVDAKNTSRVLSFMGLGGIIILGVSSIFVIRRKNNNNVPDYVEQNLKASDITIME